MKEKDLAEKQLMAYEDVYADILNVLLFHGERLILQENLETAATQSTYVSQKELRGQERDLAKYWRKQNIRIAFIGMENQTAVKKNMPLRIIGYDGAMYRTQLLKEGQKIWYPVITIVLYFGYKRRWKAPKRLVECLQVPRELLPYVNDYRINLFEVAFLEEEQVAMFQSDFRIIADYFVQMRKRRNYVPSNIPMKHSYETLKLLSVLAKDVRFVRVYEKGKEGGLTMCEVLDRIEARGFKRGEKRGEKRGRYNVLKELVEEGILTVEEAAKRINMSQDKFSKMMD